MKHGTSDTDSGTAVRHTRPTLLSVIMPAYNEERIIREAIDSSLAVDLGPVKIEMIIVNDGSDDGTSTILEDYLGVENIKIFTHEKNQGKGAAIRTALSHATGDIITIEDADLELDPNDYPRLIEPIMNNEADVVFGSRFKGKVENMSLFSWLGNRLVSLITSLLFWTWVSDEATCYKVFRREILMSFDLKCTGFEFCPEVTAKMLRAGYRYVEVPVDYCGRSVHDGKKVKARDGLHAIRTLVKYRFVS